MTQHDESGHRRPDRDHADEPALDDAGTAEDQGTGDRSSGDRGTGDRSSGDGRTGDGGTGDRSAGDRSTGDGGTEDGGTGDRSPDGAADNATSGAGTGRGTGHEEPHGSDTGARLNWLRAGVLGSNDGIVSTGAIVLGVAGSAASSGSIVTAGIAGLFAGALSMGAGEYVSVSGQRDVQRMLLNQEKWELENQPDAELRELTQLYQKQGLSGRLARRVAEQRTQQDALAAHAQAELGMDPDEFDELTNPWRPAFASFTSFALGAVLPLLTIALTPASVRVGATFGVSALSLLLTGTISARLSKVPPGRAIVRNILGGLFALAITFGIGELVGMLVL